MVAPLDGIFQPRSIAVIGASRHKGKVGWTILHNLIRYEFQGTIYPVNPHARHIHSLRAYPTVAAIPDPVDLAIVVVPAEQVLEVMEECGKKGVRGAVVITAGFKEIQGPGAERESKLREILTRHGIRMIGPNCMGIINTDPGIRLDATFAPTLPEEGGLSFVTQSGALGVAILDHAKNIKAGFSKFVSLGNATNVSGNDLLEVWEDDPRTKVILMYIENFGNPRRFVTIARRITKKKPIIALKSGRTEAGARASLSHTGSLGVLDAASDALFEQCGVLRVNSIEELFDLATALHSQSLPQGPRIAIVSNAGGPAIMATDALIGMGLEMSRFSESTQQKLQAMLPPEASPRNPVDMIADADSDRYEKALRIVLSDESVDAAIVIFVPPVPQFESDVARAIGKVSREHSKTVLSCFLGRDETSPGFLELAAQKIPSYLFPENAAKALAGMVRYKNHLDREYGSVRHFTVDTPRAQALLDNARRAGKVRLPEGEALQLLESYGIPTAPWGLCQDLEGCAATARRIGFPVALKALSPQLIHKTEAGAIALDIREEGELLRQFMALKERFAKAGLPLEGFLVQKFIVGGKEVILGMNEDPQFGSLLAFGLGGIYVEVLKDIAYRLAPLTDKDAERMVRSIRGFPLLAGVRGEPGVDLPAVEDAMLRLSQMVTDLKGLRSIDINPFKVQPKGSGGVAVDARVILAESDLGDLLTSKRPGPP